MNEQNNNILSDLILENKELIYYFAHKLGNRNIIDDLFQVGAIAVIKAYENFKQDKGSKFSTYAYLYILGEMKRYLRQDRSIKVSRELIYLSSKIEKASNLIAQKLKREPTISELATYLEIEEYKVVEALEIKRFVWSIDEPINTEGKEVTIQDVIAKEESFDQLDYISLKCEMDRLPDKDRELIKMRYWYDKTQTETAAILKMSQVQVSRGEQRVLTHLRNNLYH